MKGWARDVVAGALLACGIILVCLFSTFDSTFLYQGF